MRFAYIDSQGNEVSIPSVDALALRIELGAIGPDTQLYDAQGDRWGPAESHEIYHTLARDVAGEDFPIPAPPPPELEEGAPLGPGPGEGVTPESSAPPSPTAAPGDLGLTLASDATDTAAPEPSATEAGLENFQLDVTDDVAPAAEDTPLVDAYAPDELMMDTGMAGLGESDRPVSGDGAADTLDLEPSMDFGGGSEDDFGGGLDLEPPMADFDPSAPPAWMEHDGPSAADAGEPLMDFSAGLDEHDEDVMGQAPVPLPSGEAPRPTPRPSRPPPRRPAPRRSLAKPVIGILILAAVGASGWYGWQEYGDRLIPEPARPEVVIPEIPAALEPAMREIADAAIVRMFHRLEEGALQDGLPEAPSEDWLAGIYLGNASDFPDVASFWDGMRGFAQRLGAEGEATFHDAYLALADSSELEPDAVPIVVERADSGFLATRDDRAQTYELLGALADASLALHEFLLTHEADVRYTPARGFAGNPVEEAVPATAEIGDEMWALVEDITNALDRLGTLDRVTRERLNAVVLQRIRDIGIR